MALGTTSGSRTTAGGSFASGAALYRRTPTSTFGSPPGCDGTEDVVPGLAAGVSDWPHPTTRAMAPAVTADMRSLDRTRMTVPLGTWYGLWYGCRRGGQL